MASMANSAVGATIPYFLLKGVKVNGENYLTQPENNLSPTTAQIAGAKGEIELYSPMQDGAESHGVARVIQAIKKREWALPIRLARSFARPETLRFLFAGADAATWIIWPLPPKMVASFA